MLVLPVSTAFELCLWALSLCELWASLASACELALSFTCLWLGCALIHNPRHTAASLAAWLPSSYLAAWLSCKLQFCKPLVRCLHNIYDITPFWLPKGNIYKWITAGLPYHPHVSKQRSWMSYNPRSNEGRTNLQCGRVLQDWYLL